MMFRRFSLLLLLCLALAGCKVYKQDIMFRLSDSEQAELHRAMAGAERNYRIQPHDVLSIDVYSNKGERIIDPDFELAKSLGNIQRQNLREEQTYLVRPDSSVNLPMLGPVQLGGLRLAEADSLLSARYSTYYKDAFVISRYLNKRVIVLGAPGGQVIPLTNEGMNLLEILALAGGISGKGKAHNIRLIRGPLDAAEVQLINLNTLEGMRRASLQMQPGDVVYIEPVRRMLPETVRDIAPVVGLLSNVLTLVIVLISL